MNINEIEVNGEKFGIEGVNDVHVGRTEPTGDIKPALWFRPMAYRLPAGKYGMERKLGGTDTRGDYTLDDNGVLVETTDTAYIAPRTTNMAAIKKNQSFRLGVGNYNSLSGYAYPFAVYFYDENEVFLGKSTFTCDASVTYSMGTVLMEANAPEGSRYIRVVLPYNLARSSYIYLWDNDVTDEQIADWIAGKQTELGSGWHIWDEDMYILV